MVNMLVLLVIGILVGTIILALGAPFFLRFMFYWLDKHGPKG